MFKLARFNLQEVWRGREHRDMVVVIITDCGKGDAWEARRYPPSVRSWRLVILNRNHDHFDHLQSLGIELTILLSRL